VTLVVQRAEGREIRGQNDGHDRFLEDFLSVRCGGVDAAKGVMGGVRSVRWETNPRAPPIGGVN